MITRKRDFKFTIYGDTWVFVASTQAIAAKVADWFYDNPQESLGGSTRLVIDDNVGALPS